MTLDSKKWRWYLAGGFFLLVVMLASALLIKPKPNLGYRLIPKQKVSHLVVLKQARRLEVWNQDTLIRTMSVCLGQEPVGPKRQEGDSKTPEGVYQLD